VVVVAAAAVVVVVVVVVAAAVVVMMVLLLKMSDLHDLKVSSYNCNCTSATKQPRTAN
jgi:hypothetical protein